MEKKIVKKKKTKKHTLIADEILHLKINTSNQDIKALLNKASNLITDTLSEAKDIITFHNNLVSSLQEDLKIHETQLKKLNLIIKNDMNYSNIKHLKKIRTLNRMQKKVS